jgi:hypothetical protein
VRRRILGIAALALAVYAGCGIPFRNKQAKTYVTPEGYVGAKVERQGLALDVVRMDDSSRGIEGVARFAWWQVFSITLQNQSSNPVAIPVSAFQIVDGHGKEQKALSIDEVLGYQSYVIGPLLPGQRRAIHRAFWSDDAIAPGTFAVGYVFFPRTIHTRSYKLILDPNPHREKDELVTVFPAQAEEPEAPPVVPAPVAVPPATPDSTSSAPDSVAAESAIPAAVSPVEPVAAPPADQTPQVEPDSAQPAALPSSEPAPVVTEPAPATPEQPAPAPEPAEPPPAPSESAPAPDPAPTQ